MNTPSLRQELPPLLSTLVSYGKPFMTHLHRKHPGKGSLGYVAQPSEAGSHKHPRCHGLYFTAEGMEAFSFERDLESGRRQ